MRAPDPVRAVHVVASPEAIDALSPFAGERASLQVADDEVLVFGDAMVTLGDAHAIVEDERGLVGWWLSPDELTAVVHHLEWPVPDGRPALAQGLVAGVPAKLWLEDDRALLLCATAYAHELMERLP